MCHNVDLPSWINAHARWADDEHFSNRPVVDAVKSGVVLSVVGVMARLYYQGISARAAIRKMQKSQTRSMEQMD
jgi:hypothetical protein